ncbi:MAG: MBL fold metallo-hydrolase [Clostridia bacterium]|nr:MBL fold metallo-hydrolase [Clostridia bacterium]
MLLTYGDENYLIDTGYAHTYAALKTALEQFQVERLNGVFLTHCHQDHQGGLKALAESGIQVDAWYAAKIYYHVDGGIHAAVQAAAIRGEKVTWLEAGETIPVGSDASFAVLGPIRVDEENENNNSLVMRFSSPAGSILLSGDMKKDETDSILAAGGFTSCDLFKVGHHGDNKSATKDMLRIVKPKAAVIMTDSREEADTPAPSLLSNLADLGCAVYVTQNAHDAFLFTLRGGEIISVLDVEWDHVPSRTEGLQISIDLDNDTLSVVNTGKMDVQLENCILYSSKGDETLIIPSMDLKAGKTFVIGTRKSEGQIDCFWDTKRVWNRTKLDTAILYDAYGRILAVTNNGMPE